MFPIFLEAFWYLICFDRYMARRDFSSLYERVRDHPLRGSIAPRNIGGICKAVDAACICYWKQVLCLQRSAATTCLLRKHGVDAQLVLGVQQVPFKSHAWVEVAGQVVNDKAYMPEIYAVLDRC